MMHLLPIAVLGDDNQVTAELINRVLKAGGLSQQAVALADEDELQAGVLVLLGGLTDARRVKRLIRMMDVRTGIIVALARDGFLRKHTRGFKHRFRWIDLEKPWPGVARYGLAGIAAARVAHEVGVAQEVIKGALNE